MQQASAPLERPDEPVAPATQPVAPEVSQPEAPVNPQPEVQP